MTNDEMNRVLANPDHIIMSDGLELSLGELDVTEYLELDSNLLICELLSVKRNLNLNSWEFHLIVPGLTFQDFVSFDRAIFRHGDLSFLLIDKFEFIKDSSIISARATRINKENE